MAIMDKIAADVILQPVPESPELEAYSAGKLLLLVSHLLQLKGLPS